MKVSEHQEQVALFQWAAYMEKTYPALREMYAIPNGGLRNKVVAAKLKAEGGQGTGARYMPPCGPWGLPRPIYRDEGR